MRPDLQLERARSLLAGQLDPKEFTAFVRRGVAVVLVNGPLAIIAWIDANGQGSVRNLASALGERLRRQNGSLTYKYGQVFQHRTLRDGIDHGIGRRYVLIRNQF